MTYTGYDASEDPRNDRPTGTEEIPAAKPSKPKKPKVYRIGPVEGKGPTVKDARIDAKNKAQRLLDGIQHDKPVLVYAGGTYGALVHRDVYGTCYSIVTFGPKGASVSGGCSMGNENIQTMVTQAKRHVAQLTDDRGIAHRLLDECERKAFREWCEYRHWQRRMRFATKKGLPDIEAREYAHYGPKCWPKAKRAKTAR